MKDYTIPVLILAPKGMSEARTRELLQKIIDVGVADANDTLRDENENNREALEVASLDISI